MGKNHRVADESAVGVFYEHLGRPLNAREVCEQEDATEDVLCDELAERFRAEGANAAAAMKYAVAVRELFAKKDRAVCGVETSLRAIGKGGLNWLVAEDASDRLMRAISRAREARKSKLALGCWLFAMGRQPYGLASERDLAKEQDVSPEAVGPEREAFQEILKLPRAPHQKTEAAVGGYRGTNGAKAKNKSGKQ